MNQEIETYLGVRSKASVKEAYWDSKNDGNPEKHLEIGMLIYKCVPQRRDREREGEITQGSL